MWYPQLLHNEFFKSCSFLQLKVSLVACTPPGLAEQMNQAEEGQVLLMQHLQVVRCLVDFPSRPGTFETLIGWLHKNWYAYLAWSYGNIINTSGSADIEQK